MRTAAPHNVAGLGSLVALPGYPSADPNYRLVSATEGEPGTVVVEFAYFAPAGEGRSIWTFDRSVGYLPTRHEGRSLVTGGADRVPEIRYARQMVDGNTLFYPVEAAGEQRVDAEGEWYKNIYMKVDEETLRLNPKLPDDRFELVITPQDSVFEPGTAG